uniref:Uncharacterized protein n=1 Tax=Rhizophora mucronata TaxID=61149 RepID=A0A2P2NAD7_RHIMU
MSGHWIGVLLYIFYANLHAQLICVLKC